jgi:multiple sugar transport system ATP-binding protein
MARIRFDRVTKRYANGVEAVSALDLDIADKEFVLLLGPSGCGKSTTLGMIAGLEDITAGALLFDEKRVNDVPPHHRDVAMVFQSYALYPHKSVFENIAFGLRMRKFPAGEIDRRVRDAAERLGIPQLLERRPSELSGGQRQRVALGRAMVREPSVFLMDEPLSNLDAALRIAMRAEIKQLHRTMATTFVYVTHDQAEALTLADRIVVMKDGLIQQVGSPDDIYERPANTFVASFLGSPPINYLEGEIGVADGAPVFRRGPLMLAVPAELRPRLAASGGRTVLVGLRPEDVDPQGAGRPGATLSGSVSTILPIGSDQYLGCDVAGTQMFLRVPKGIRHEVGEPVSIGIRTERLHLFDAATRQSLAA